MIDATAPSPDGDMTPPTPAGAEISQPGSGGLLLEYFLRFVVVAVAIAMGLIASLIIGLATGWIAFTC